MSTRFEKISLTLLITLLAVFYALTIRSFAYSVIFDGEWVEMRNGTVVADDFCVAEDNSEADFIEICEPPETAENMPDQKAEDNIDTKQSNAEYLGEFKFTFYCSCSRCNGRWGPIDGFGQPLEWGCVAVDPSVIPLHTKLVVDGYDTIFEARDTGSGVDGRHIDMFVPVSHSEALKMGQGKKMKVWKYIG